jgi:protein SCO1/2
VPLDVDRGHPVLIAMFYGSCPSACPTLTADIKAIERRLDAAARADLRVLLVSFDLARDTPDALARLVARHGVDPARWTFAAAPEYRRLPGGELSHSAVISLLDRDGVVTSTG